MKKLLLACLTVIFLATPAFAYRPFLTEDAEIVGNKVFQSETSWDYIKWNSKDSDNIFAEIAYFGITKNIHVAAGIPYVSHKIFNADRTNGYGDAIFVAKYVASRDKNDVAIVAYKLNVKWNNGDYDKILGYGDKEYQTSICLTQPVFENLTLHGQLGYTFVSEAKNLNYGNFIVYGVAADFTLNKTIHLAAEITGNQNPDRTLGDQRLWMVGGYYIINDHMNFDVTIRDGMTDTSPNYQLGTGLVIHY